MKLIHVPAPLAQAIGEYLSTKPYREVAALLAGLQQAIDAPREMPPPQPGYEGCDQEGQGSST